MYDLLENLKIIKMKKNLFLSAFIILLSSASSLAQTDWGYWHETDCLKGLEFRVKRLEYNQYAKKYKWAVQFRNKYQQDIHFNCIAVEPQREREIKASGKTSDRIHVKANNDNGHAWFLVDSPSSVYVFVNRIRIGDKDNGDYSNCDK